MFVVLLCVDLKETRVMPTLIIFVFQLVGWWFTK